MQVERRTDGRTRAERWQAMPGWVEAVAIAVVSRAFSLAVLFGAWALRLPPTSFKPVDNPLVIWDAQWYSFIAHNGYHADAVVKTQYGPGLHDFAFFPAWPMLVKAVSLDNRLPIDTVAPILANLLFVLATVSIFSILERVGGRSVARWGLALFAFGPASYVYSLGYSEPLFLLFVSRFFVSIEEQPTTSSSLRSAVLAMGTQLVRVTGAALAFASLPDLLDRETRRRGFLIIGGSIVAFAAWWTWIALLTHNPTGYLLGTPSWFLNFQPTPIPTGIASLGYADVPMSFVAVILIALLALGTRWVARRGELRLALFCFACLASTMLDTQTTMPRLASVAFPAFGGLAALLPSTRWRALALAIFIGAQLVIAAYTVRRLLVP
ncbi:MAG TPA: mannosyltransferase family protein [Candidatus Acidoferrales bacterium]|nr:mannosyltransferase family protein [Candidatus Acidoferrales bacterium]